MVAKDNNFRNSSVDNADNIPFRRGDVFLFVDKVQDNVVGRGAYIVLDTFVAKTTSFPVLAEVVSFGAVAIQSLEQRQCVRVGDGDRGN